MTEQLELTSDSDSHGYFEYFVDTFDVSAEIIKYKNDLRGKKILCPFNSSVTYEEIEIYSKKDGILPLKKEIQSPTAKFLLNNADSFGIESLTICGYNPLLRKGIHFKKIEYSGYDLVVDTPPNSIFFDAIKCFLEAGIGFLIVGLQTAIIDSALFDLIKDGKLWLGYHFFSAEINSAFPNEGISQNFYRCCWYTNLDVEPRHTIFFSNKEAGIYKRPDECICNDVLYVDKIENISTQHIGAMCVPFEFLKTYNPKQFKLIRPGYCNDIKKIRAFVQQARIVVENFNKS